GRPRSEQKADEHVAPVVKAYTPQADEMLPQQPARPVAAKETVRRPTAAPPVVKQVKTDPTPVPQQPRRGDSTERSKRQLSLTPKPIGASRSTNEPQRQDDTGQRKSDSTGSRGIKHGIRETN